MSIKFILCFSHSTKFAAKLIDTRRFCSSGSKSITDVASSTLPNRSLFPETNNKDSQSDVLPVPPCPTIAKFRRDLDSYFAMKTPFND